MTPRKYPRTPHLPWSPGATSDDTRIADTSRFVERKVVVTEKLDGECTTIYSDGTCHARSVDSKDHPSRHYVKGLAASLKGRMEEDWRIVGENVFAKHSIEYNSLPNYFLAFGLHVGDGLVAGWDKTEEICARLGLKMVPVLYRGLWDRNAVQACLRARSEYGLEQEGYVVRIADAFSLNDFDKWVAKYVRPNHVQTDEHWMTKKVVPNGLRRR